MREELEIRRELERELEALAEGKSSADAHEMREELEKLGVEDPEVAHELADVMVRRALRCIREGYGDPAELARQVLIVDSAEFSRWCA